ncbi:MAG: amylo-alpha-1,6-glucosidase [Candidatus Pacebacteria bacterium]|nr:amylo-alpha-1,6-glucosidase [Candidatus Paceibacterota bacterium]
MKIVHKLSKNFLEEEILQGEASGNAGFLLANKKGDYASFFDEEYSRYQGWFFRKGGNMLKMAENIELAEKEKIQEIKNEFWRITRNNKTKIGFMEESFFLPQGQRALVYELSNPALFNLFLDFKPIYDNSEEKRFYKIEIKGKNAVIECQNKNESVFLAIKTDSGGVSLKEQWIKRHYKLDEQRNSLPFERYVFWALSIKAKKTVLAVSDDKKQAKKEAKYVFEKTWKLKKEKRKSIREVLEFPEIKDKKTAMAFHCCQSALSQLVFEENNQIHVAAGLPWFFSVYSRDELIALKAIKGKQADVFWKIIFQQINLIGENGLLPNKINHESAQNADSIGWLFKRAGEFLETKKINEITLWKMKKQLEKTLENLSKFSNSKEFALSFGNDTWMDTVNRAGERIEIQALRLYMLKLAYKLTEDSSFKVLESSLKFKVKEKFWTGEVLLDSPNDYLIRPNVFLAAYTYPELLENAEWQTCFDNILPALWLPWGGLATCDKNSQNFTPNHTGEIPQSYHSGDSWFYLNNLTAIVLHKVNPERYKDYIGKILEGSRKEILFMGAVSCHAEVSSASELKSQGAWSQAWSNALFIELIKELKL